MDHQLEVYSSAISFHEENLRGKTAVMIDVLRASSTIVTALEHGAKGVIPVADMGAGSQIAQSMDTPNFLLCGEKDGEKIEGYDLGNSPLEYTEEIVAGKTIILKTTNGTKALMRSSFAEEIMVGCFLNIKSVVESLRGRDGVVLVCAGWRGRLSLEDLLCAGNIIYELNNDTLPPNVGDGAKVALGLYEKFGDDIYKAIESSDHAVRLQGIVEEEDLSYCSRVGVMNTLPIMKEGVILDFHGKER